MGKDQITSELMNLVRDDNVMTYGEWNGVKTKITGQWEDGGLEGLNSFLLETGREGGKGWYFETKVLNELKEWKEKYGGVSVSFVDSIIRRQEKANEVKRCLDSQVTATSTTNVLGQTGWGKCEEELHDTFFAGALAGLNLFLKEAAEPKAKKIDSTVAASLRAGPWANSFLVYTVVTNATKKNIIPTPAPPAPIVATAPAPLPSPPVAKINNATIVGGKKVFQSGEKSVFIEVISDNPTDATIKTGVTRNEATHTVPLSKGKNNVEVEIPTLDPGAPALTEATIVVKPKDGTPFTISGLTINPPLAPAPAPRADVNPLKIQKTVWGENVGKGDSATLKVVQGFKGVKNVGVTLDKVPADSSKVQFIVKVDDVKVPATTHYINNTGSKKTFILGLDVSKLSVAEHKITVGLVGSTHVGSPLTLVVEEDKKAVPPPALKIALTKSPSEKDLTFEKGKKKELTFTFDQNGDVTYELKRIDGKSMATGQAVQGVFSCQKNVPCKQSFQVAEAGAYTLTIEYYRRKLKKYELNVTEPPGVRPSTDAGFPPARPDGGVVRPSPDASPARPPDSGREDARPAARPDAGVRDVGFPPDAAAPAVAQKSQFKLPDKKEATSDVDKINSLVEKQFSDLLKAVTYKNEEGRDVKLTQNEINKATFNVESSKKNTPIGSCHISNKAECKALLNKLPSTKIKPGENVKIDFVYLATLIVPVTHGTVTTDWKIITYKFANGTVEDAPAPKPAPFVRTKTFEAANKPTTE